MSASSISGPSVRAPIPRGERARERALSMLIDRYSPMDPFRFIIYSQWANMALRPIDDGQAEPR